jgi:hypothetical protein
MSELLHAVEKLTRPWSDVLSPDETGLDRYLPVDYPPLLDMLDEACRANTGERSHGSASDPASRSLLDLEAHMLRNNIEGAVKTWIVHLSKGRAERDLKAAVVQLAGILQAHKAAGTITDADYVRVSGFFPRWCEQVWTIFDPPKVLELNGTCPNPDCGQSKFTDRSGDVGSALVVFHKGTEGSAYAKCRACGWEWDRSQMVLLGQHIGATQNHEVISAAGLSRAVGF